jgi:HD superfamily phosphohydrolase
LDYLLRDARFTFGTQRSYDERILKYFRLGRQNKKTHLLITLFDTPGVRADDVLISLEELLRLRYMLAERVYYYHTKIQADAMVAKAVAETNWTRAFK